MFVTATFHATQKPFARRFPPPPCCTCTIAIGFTCHRRQTDNSAGSRWSAGKMLPPNLQEIVSGVEPGDRVVTNALVLQNTAEQ